MEGLEPLIAKARAGDLEAFGRIVDRFRDMACGYGYSILADFDLAEDAAQEAFIEAYRDLPQLRQPAAFPGWLRRILFKYCDRIMRRRRLWTVPLDSVGEVASSVPGPAELAEKRELHERLRQAIRALPENERVVTTLFYINGYSHDDIAAFLEVRPTTVKSRLHSSRNHLKERMIGMVEETLRGNAPDDRFSQKVIDRLLGQPRLLEIEGHPIRQIWELICSALPEYRVIRTEETVHKKALLPLVQQDTDSGIFDRIAYRVSEEAILRTSMPLSTLQAIRGLAPPVRLLAAGRVFNAAGWPNVPRVKIGHVCDLICIEEGVDDTTIEATVEKAIQAAFGAIEIQVKWNGSGHGVREPINPVGTFAVKVGNMWHDVCRGGMLTPDLLGQAGYDPRIVRGGHFGIGLERMAMAKFGIDDVSRFWQPPYVPT